VAPAADADRADTGGDSAAAGGAAGFAASVADRVAAPVKALLTRLFLVRRILSDLQRDLARIQWSQTEVLARLKEIKQMPTVVARPGDRLAAISELWQIRDLLSDTDPDQAAQIVTIYNQLIERSPGSDAT
jgi:hypothetical protein